MPCKFMEDGPITIKIKDQKYIVRKGSLSNVFIFGEKSLAPVSKESESPD